MGAIVTPQDGLKARQWSWRVFGTLVVGLTMTAIIIAYLVISLRKAIQLERLTAKLHDNAAQIAHLAYYDALTNLPNRLLFQNRINQAVEGVRRETPFALLYLDLDHFKAVNDSFGHSAGDRLLCAVAERINACVREVDSVARLGGDEFAVILADTEGDEKIARIAHRLVTEVGRPYAIEGHSVVIGLSIGITTAASNKSAETFRKEADLALYAAKDAGRGASRFFSNIDSGEHHNLTRKLQGLQVDQGLQLENEGRR